ncbi:MAG: glycosyltransferase [Candidatus Aenigmarchaeota archaeon]|nr:glycosyltransferase [Candidatus Aenigmarchaeota archaeon]
MVTNTIFFILYFIVIYILTFYLITFLKYRKKFHFIPKVSHYPKVSLIIPAYNEEDSIARTLDSVLALDYPKDKLEIIVVNDGSTDNTAKIVEKYVKNNGVILINKPNGGKGNALNVGISVSTGEFIATLDADSMVAPNSLKYLIGYFKDKDVGAVTSAIKVFEPKNFLQRMQFIEYTYSIFLRKIWGFLNSQSVTPGPLSVFRADVIKKLGGFDENNLTEDQEIALRIHCAGYKIENCILSETYTFAPSNFKSLWKQRLRWYRGTLRNFIRYRHMFLNRKFGNLGVFVLPSIVMLIFSLFISLAKMIFDFYDSIYLSVKSVFLVGINFYMPEFSISPILTNFFLSINVHSFLLSFMFVGAAFMLYLSYKFSKEYIGSRSVLDLLIFIFFFQLLYIVFWGSAIIYELMRIKAVTRGKW